MFDGGLLTSMGLLPMYMASGPAHHSPDSSSLPPQTEFWFRCQLLASVYLKGMTTPLAAPQRNKLAVVSPCIARNWFHSPLLLSVLFRRHSCLCPISARHSGFSLFQACVVFWMPAPTAAQWLVLVSTFPLSQVLVCFLLR